jgi:hypothetical protein
MSEIDDLLRDRSARLTADRIEIKYVMPADQAAGFARSMAPLLSLHRYQDSDIEPSPHAEHYATTVYFDTADKHLYRAAVYEPVHVKVRAREYYEVRPGGSDLEADLQDIVQPRPETWIELKLRDGQRSRKRRVRVAKLDVPSLLGALEVQNGAGAPGVAANGEVSDMLEELQRVRGQLPAPFGASCVVNYRRISWQDAGEALRVTLDSDVSAFAPPPDLWTRGSAASRHVLGRPLLQEPSCVLEIKSRGQPPAWLEQVLAKHRATEIEYSKFVMASRAVHGPI